MIRELVIKNLLAGIWARRREHTRVCVCVCFHLPCNVWMCAQARLMLRVNKPLGLTLTGLQTPLTASSPAGRMPALSAEARKQDIEQRPTSRHFDALVQRCLFFSLPVARDRMDFDVQARRCMRTGKCPRF